MLKEKLTKVIKHWWKEKIKVAPPSSEVQIVQCFRLIDRPLSKDVLEFTAFAAECWKAIWTQRFCRFGIWNKF
ncbi:MAG: hypothetical protein ABJA66_03250 [Actinomycetota bacterium]